LIRSRLSVCWKNMAWSAGYTPFETPPSAVRFAILLAVTWKCSAATANGSQSN